MSSFIVLTICFLFNIDTPLHIALRNNDVNKAAIEMMIKSCPDSLSISNKEGLLPLHISCRYCPTRSDIIELIAKSHPIACFAQASKHGALVNHRTSRALTYLVAMLSISMMLRAHHVLGGTEGLVS